MYVSTRCVLLRNFTSELARFIEYPPNQAVRMIDFINTKKNLILKYRCVLFGIN